MATLKKPLPLQPGDAVALLSPAGPIPSDDVADKCADAVKSWGYQVRVGDHVNARHRYLAGTDQQRADDINGVLRNSEEKAFFCTRGGYGCCRQLDLIDYKAMNAQPTIATGFSDLTALHSAFLTQAQTVALHSPTIAMGYVYEGERVTTDGHDLYMKMLTTSEPAGSMRAALDFETVHAWQGGKAKGQLIGGNLAVFAGILGSKYMPDPKGKILFLEDLAEAPYKLDRLMMLLRLSGYLGQLNGIILGHFTDCDSDRSTWRESIETCLDGINIPILSGYPTGHEERNAPLPMGCNVELDADGLDVVYLESFCAAN